MYVCIIVSLEVCSVGNWLRRFSQKDVSVNFGSYTDEESSMKKEIIVSLRPFHYGIISERWRVKCQALMTLSAVVSVRCNHQWRAGTDNFEFFCESISSQIGAGEFAGERCHRKWEIHRSTESIRWVPYFRMFLRIALTHRADDDGALHVAGCSADHCRSASPHYHSISLRWRWRWRKGATMAHMRSYSVESLWICLMKNEWMSHPLSFQVVCDERHWISIFRGHECFKFPHPRMTQRLKMKSSCWLTPLTAWQNDTVL